jgi:hypothetical protein
MHFTRQVDYIDYSFKEQGIEFVSDQNNFFIANEIVKSYVAKQLLI